MATSWFGPWRMEIQKMDFPDPNYQIDLSIFADFSFIFQNEKNGNVRKNSYKGVKLLECHQKNLLPF